MTTRTTAARTLFLHAGPPKTGSTAIQQFFHRNRAVLEGLGLYRPQNQHQPPRPLSFRPRCRI